MSLDPSVKSAVVAYAEIDCAICFEKIDSDAKAEEEKPIALNCSHIFHRACIGSWLEQKHSCPLCRTRVSVDTPEARPPEMSNDEFRDIPDHQPRAVADHQPPALADDYLNAFLTLTRTANYFPPRQYIPHQQYIQPSQEPGRDGPGRQRAVNRQLAQMGFSPVAIRGGHQRILRPPVQGPLTPPVQGPLTPPVQGPLTPPVQGPLTPPVQGSLTPRALRDRVYNEIIEGLDNEIIEGYRRIR